MRLSEKKGNFKVSREEWVRAARSLLIKQGIAQVKIERLAQLLGVTRGGFYWFFKNRDDLWDALLEDWRKTNTEPFFDAVAKAGPDGLAQTWAVAQLWIAEKDFNPAYDAAVRDWARVSQKARKAVEQVDQQRIELLKKSYDSMGFEEEEALIRARITYFHQVGYYSLGMREPKSQRQHYLPMYMKILSGSPSAPQGPDS